MDEARRVTVSFTETEELRDAVSGGEFPNAEAAVSAALDRWTADRIVARIGIDRLREEWGQGIAGGDPRPLDGTELMREILTGRREKVGST